MLTDEQQAYLYEDLLHPLHFLWFAVKQLFDVKAGDSCPDNFTQRRSMFLYLLHRLMHEDRLKLAKNGNILEENVEALAAQFHDAFPKSDEEIDMGGAGTWFFTDSCPAGAVWVLDDGSLYWT